MILINVKWHVKAEFAEEWPSIVSNFTRATQAEAGNVFFEWSRGIDDPNDYYLVECFRDADAGAAHVQTEHFVTATSTFGKYVSANPEIIYVDSEAIAGWGPMAEVQPEY